MTLDDQRAALQGKLDRLAEEVAETEKALDALDLRILRPMITFTIPWPTQSQNVYGKGHWSKRHRATQRYELALHGDMLRRRLTGWSAKGKRRVTITRYSSGTLDQGNLVGGCKPLIDAMVRLGLLVDDTPELLEDHYAQVKIPRKEMPRTAVEIEDAA